MQIMTIAADGGRELSGSAADISGLLAAEPVVIWVDMAATADDAAEPVLRDIFQFHPLAVDDALNEVHIPKIDDWVDYLYLVLRDVVYEGSELSLPELDIFLGERFIVTYHPQPIAAVNRVWARAQFDSRLAGRGADYLMVQLIDEIVEDCTQAVDVMMGELELLEAETLAAASGDTLEEIMRLRRQVLQLRRITMPQRDVAAKLARDPFSVVGMSEQVFFRDVYDHLLRLYDLIENMRDLASSALEIYLSAVNNRTNDIMRTLTVITTMFMPLTFLTGFFGMNFFAPAVQLTAWTGWVAFLLLLGFISLAPLAMYWWMRRRGWMN